MATTKWNIGQTVEVQSRTWAGINREGGCGRITNIHYAEDGAHVEALDVKYVLSGCIDKNIDPAIVSPFETLQRGGRKRRGRDFLMELEPQPEKPRKHGIEKKDGTRSSNVEQKAAIHDQQVSKKTNQSPIPAEPSPVTTESSATTPERKPKAKKVTPIPAYIIADGKIQVSPLPTHDGHRRKAASRPAVARRGLFAGNSDLPSASEEQKKKSSQYLVPTTADAPVLTTPRASRVAVGKEAAGKLAKNDSSSAQPQSSLAVRDDLQIARRRPTFGHKKVPPKPVLEFNRKTDLTKSSQNAKNPRKPLKDVYDKELKKAENFVKDIVGSRKHDTVALAAKENTTTSQQLVKKPTHTDRYIDFLAVFRIVRMKVEEGMIEESHFRKLVNEKSTTGHFADDEINSHLEKLCDDGKVMRSSGTIYIID